MRNAEMRNALISAGRETGYCQDGGIDDTWSRGVWFSGKARASNAAGEPKNREEVSSIPPSWQYSVADELCVKMAASISTHSAVEPDAASARSLSGRGDEASSDQLTAGSRVSHARRLLAERFPKMRTWTENAVKTQSCWPTGLAQLDALLRNGLPRGAITELVSAKSAAGGALVARAILRQAYESRQLIALIDGRDAFDAATLPQRVLSRLLWVRCQTAAQALKAADIVLRDRNLPVVILDLKMNSMAQTQKISATAWYRLQRLAQQTATAVLVLTARPMIGNADARLMLENRFGSAALSQNQSALLAALKFKLTRWALGEQAATVAPPDACTA